MARKAQKILMRSFFFDPPHPMAGGLFWPSAFTECSRSIPPQIPGESVFQMDFYNIPRTEAKTEMLSASHWSSASRSCVPTALCTFPSGDHRLFSSLNNLN
jgi:hypothetical protein